jgi:hypothetical protein
MSDDLSLSRRLEFPQPDNERRADRKAWEQSRLKARADAAAFEMDRADREF